MRKSPPESLPGAGLGARLRDGVALIPMLAVVVNISSAILEKEGEDQIDKFIMKLVASVRPWQRPNKQPYGRGHRHG